MNDLPICAHYTATLLRQCYAGRVAFRDCGVGCRAYDPDPVPEERDEHERELWEGTSE
jgi:hypothetical protein